jgi:transposase
MPTKRKAMRQIKEVLRLKFEAGLSHERIAAACGVSKGAVSKYVKRAAEVGIGWPLPAHTDDAALEALLFAHPAPPAGGYAAPPFAHIHQELKRKGVTLALLWEEYLAAHPEGAYRYSQFCWHYGRFRESLKRSMRQVHRAGDKLFIDYSGDTLPIIDAASGEVRRAELFIAVLGASNYTFAEATWTQQLPDWIGSHIRAFEFMGAVPALLIPDYVAGNIIRANDPGHPAQVAERAFVQAHKRLQFLIPHPFLVAVPGVPQGHAKHPRTARLPGCAVQRGRAAEEIHLPFRT